MKTYASKPGAKPLSDGDKQTLTSTITALTEQHPLPAGSLEFFGKCGTRDAILTMCSEFHGGPALSGYYQSD